ERALDPLLDLVAAGVLKAIAELAIALHRLGPAGGLGIGDSAFELLQLGLDGVDMLKGGLHLLPERAVGLEAHLLSQVSAAGAAGGRDLASVGRLDAGDDLEQSALPGSIHAHQSDLLAAGYLEAHI